MTARRIIVLLAMVAMIAAGFTVWSVTHKKASSSDLLSQVTAGLPGPKLHPADLNFIERDPERIAGYAAQRGDWRVLSGPAFERAEGVTCAFGHADFAKRSVIPIMYAEVISEPVALPPRPRPLSATEKAKALSYARYNQRIISYPQNPLRPFCRKGGYTDFMLAHGSGDERPPPKRPQWTVLTELPPQDTMLAAARANQIAQVRLLALPETVKYDFLQTSFIGWAVIHRNYDLLSRVVAARDREPYCRSLQPDLVSRDSNIRSPIMFAMDNGDAKAARLLMLILSSPACQSDAYSFTRSLAFSGALSQAERAGPPMVTAVVGGYHLTNGDRPWGLAEQLRKKGLTAAARIAALRWGSIPWFNSGVYECDAPRTRFWLDVGNVTDDQLDDAMLALQRSLKPNSQTRADRPPTSDCPATFRLLRRAMAR